MRGLWAQQAGLRPRPGGATALPRLPAPGQRWGPCCDRGRDRRRDRPRCPGRDGRGGRACCRAPHRAAPPSGVGAARSPRAAHRSRPAGPAEISKITGEPWCHACQKRRARCAVCGSVRLIRGGTLTSPLCGTCTPPDPSFWHACPGCGERTQHRSRRCARCSLLQRLDELLRDGTGAIHPRLQALHHNLAGNDPPDTWLTSDHATHLGEAGNFVRWARRQKLTSLDFAATRWDGPASVIDTEARWHHARRLLHDDTLKPEDRVAGLLLLLYAQGPAAISRLTLDHVHPGEQHLRLRLGREPIVLPEPLGALVLQLVASRRGHAALGDQGSSRWLFPGGQPGQPISACRLAGRLRQLGLRPGPAPSTALFGLPAELPAT